MNDPRPMLEDLKECWSCGAYEGQDHYEGCAYLRLEAEEGYDGILGEG